MVETLSTYQKIPKKIKVAELKEKLAKRGQSTRGLKAVLLEHLKEALGKHLPVLTGADQSAHTNDDLKGFTATAWWKPLVPQEVAVPEQQNIVTTLHAPTVSRQDASFLPQKQNFAEVFDREPFVTKEKVPRFYQNGQPMLNNGQTVWTEQFTNEGGPMAEFLFDNGLNMNSTPQDWLMAFLPLYDGTAWCPDRESNVCFSHKWAKFTNMKAVQMGAGVQGGCYPSIIPFTYNEIEHLIGLYILQDKWKQNFPVN